MTAVPPDLVALVEPFRARPSDAVLLFDFDGTLSPVVDDPDSAQPAPGVGVLLGELAVLYRRVAVVSGRPAAFLARHLPRSVDLSTLYGLESRMGGVVAEHAEAGDWRAAVAEAAEAADAEAAVGGPLHGMRVEAKGLSITLHTRTCPHLGPAAEAFALRIGQQTGLEVRPAKMSVELHPPIRVDKGTAVRALAQGAAAVLFVGDDVGDVPAFDELAALRALGVHVLGVAVGSPELPAALGERADLVLPDQPAVATLLEALRP